MQPGRPRYVVVSGDQPTYRMIVKIWRNSYLQSVGGSPSESMAEDLRVHEWVIPFPGFFHIEKQSLYPLCKEMLHGIRLEELAACSGFSRSQVDNILKHSHARNNRAVLFNICAAMILHTSDIVQTESPDLKDAVDNVPARSSRNNASAKISRDSTLLRCTNQNVTEEPSELAVFCGSGYTSSF